MDQSPSVPRLSCSTRQVCVELKRLGSSGFALVLGSLFLQKVALSLLVVKFWGWCISQSRAFLGFLGNLLYLRGFLCKLLLRSLLGSFLSLATSVNQKNVLLKLISVEKFLLDLA
jgi:hypothetical protein